MKLTRLVRFGLPALALLLAVLLIGPAAGVRAQEGEPAGNDPAASQPEAAAAALSTAFTYQGRLNDGANPANGLYDFQFSLWDALGSGSPPAGGVQIGATVAKNDLQVSSGALAVDLDFGATAFDGQARWLQVAVRPGASTGAYTTLAPRRPLLASPYATYSNNTRGMIVTSDGRVGFGVNPAHRFQFQGNSSNGNGMLVVGNARDSRTAEFRYPGTTSVGLMRAGIRIAGDVDGINYADFAIYGGNAIIDNGIAGGNILLNTLNQGGRVGINTLGGPTQTLDIQGKFSSGNGLLVVGHARDSRTAEFRFPGTTDVGNMRAGIRIAGDVGGVNYADFSIYRGNAFIDNQIAGGNIVLYTLNRGGKVGINTTEPAGQLDVVGNVISRGSNAELTVINPANQNASVNLNWKNNVARIRIGGEGAGASGGLDIQGVGDVSLLRIRSDGTTSTKVLEIRGGADLAEPFAITDRPEPGLVVAIDPDHIGQLRVADSAYDRTVAGVISGAGGLQPGLTMQQPEVVQGEAHPVALTGRVYVWADASFGAIQPGDLLTTSATPGHAMRVGDYDQAQGAILGKAMSRLEEGKGLVLVLVSLQ